MSLRALLIGSHVSLRLLLTDCIFPSSPKLNVISRLDSIADIVVRQTGIFLSGPHLEPSLPVRPEARCVLKNNNNQFLYTCTCGTFYKTVSMRIGLDVPWAGFHKDVRLVLSRVRTSYSIELRTSPKFVGLVLQD